MNQARQDLLDLAGRQGHVDLQDLLGRRVLPVNEASPDHQVPQDHPDRLDLEERMGKVVNLDLQDRQDLEGQMVRQLGYSLKAVPMSLTIMLSVLQCDFKYSFYHFI